MLADIPGAKDYWFDWQHHGIFMGTIFPPHVRCVRERLGEMPYFMPLSVDYKYALPTIPIKLGLDGGIGGELTYPNGTTPHT